jgi:hypothetical protein
VVELRVKDSNALDRLLAVLRSPERAEEFVQQPAVWEEIKRLAEVHRFTAHLAWVTSAWLPSAERPWRDRVLMQHHSRHSRRLALLQRLLGAFREAGIELVSLKGPLLAERFYPVPFLRRSTDLDLMVAEQDIGRAARLMLQLGYTLEGEYPWDVVRRTEHHLEFRSAGESEVELHYALIATPVRFDSSQFMARSVNWKSASGLEAKVLCPVDEAFHSFVHAASHAFHRLRWAYDFLLISKTLTAEERSELLDMTRAHGQGGPLATVCLAASEFFGETPVEDADLAPAWLRYRPKPRHIRRMVNRVSGGGNLLASSPLSEKLGHRVDLARIAGSPSNIVRAMTTVLARTARGRWYAFRHRLQPGLLARTLPD